jgi:hypothetical protein
MRLTLVKGRGNTCPKMVIGADGRASVFGKRVICRSVFKQKHAVHERKAAFAGGPA